MIPTKEHISTSAKIGSIDEYRQMYQRSLDDPAGFWREQADRLDWFHPPGSAGDYDYDRVDISWFEGGKLNVCHNCVDRHLETQPDKTAIIWAADVAGKYERITYRQLQRRVSRAANVLKAHGVKRGDRVCIYLPMIPELAYVMLACARLSHFSSTCITSPSSPSS